jgi:hypothetical protein
MQLLSANASVLAGDLEANAEVQTGPTASPTSLPTPLGTISLVAPTLTGEGGISSPIIGGVSGDLLGAGLDVSSSLSPIADVSVGLAGGSGGASPSVSPPPTSSPTSGSAVSDGLPRSGEIARTAISGSTQSGLSSSPTQGQGRSDLFGPRGPPDPARAGPTASLPLDLSSESHWPSASAGAHASIPAPLAESHAPAGGAPGSASSSAASGSAVGLLATLALALLLAARRLELADSMRRPMLFVSLLERPG